MTGKRDEIYVIGVVPAPTWETDAASLPASREELLAAFADFHHDLRRVLEVAEDVSVWPIYDRARDDRWSGGRIVLLGDACHPMRPYMAAGGAMAVEDGAILSRCLATFDAPARGLSLLPGDPHPPRRRCPADLDREQLDARSDRHRLVLWLRSMHGTADAAAMTVQIVASGVCRCLSQSRIP